MEPSLQDMVESIVQAVHPLRVIVFGSAARGDAGPESDVDVLVVVPEGTHRRRTAGSLHRRFFGLPFVGEDDVIAVRGRVQGLLDSRGSRHCRPDERRRC